MNEPSPDKEFEARMEDYRRVIFAPRGIKDLRSYYPELFEYPEFKPQAIKHHDLLFVWWYACACSPLYDRDDKEKLEECIHLAYPNAQQRAAKTAEFTHKIPDNIISAAKRMGTFNTHQRIENYIYTRTVRDNCKAMLGQDVSLMDSDEKDAWATRAPKLWKLLEETTRTIERGAFGVSAYEETNLDEADGTLRAFRQSRK